MEKKMNLLNGPIFQTLMKLALPIMGTSFIQMAYNLIDMIWIGKLGSAAVAAVGSAGMYMWLSNGVSTIVKMGGQVCVGQAIGSSQKQKAIEYSEATFQLGILFGIIFGVITILFYRPMIGFFNLNSKEVIEQAQIYLIITCGLVGVNFINQIFTSLMTAIGDSQHPFIATTIGLVINIILDPIGIFVFDLGVMGAAIATVIAQIIVCLLMIYYARKDTLLFGELKMTVKVPYQRFQQILKIGLPTGIQSICFTFISMVIARFIAGYGDEAIAVQKVGSQIESISWLSAEGFGSALNAFVAQNYGNQNLERVQKGTNSALKTCILWGIFTTIILFGFPQYIFQVFISEKDVILLGIDYLQILAFSQLFMCIESTLAGTLNGIGKTFIPSCVSITFTAARIPLVMVLSSTFLGLNGIWWSISISSVCKGLMMIACFIYVKKKISLQK